MGDTYVKSGEIKKTFYIDATNFYGHSMSHSLSYDETEMWHGHPDLYMNKLEEILKTPDDADISSFVEVDLKYSDVKKQKTKNFPFAPENEVFPGDKYIEYLKKIKPENYTKAKKIICDWTD